MKNISDFLKKPEKQKSKITSERQLVIKDFLDQLNPPRIASGRKPLSPGFVSMKMRFMTTSEMKVFYGECGYAENFSKHWWWRLDVKKQENPMNREKLLELLREDYRQRDLDALRKHFNLGTWLLTPEDKTKVSGAIYTLESNDRTPLINHTLKTLGGRLL